MHTIAPTPSIAAQPALRGHSCPQCGTADSRRWFPVSGICIDCKTTAVRQQVAREHYERLGHEIAREDSCRRLAAMAPINCDGWYDTGFAMLVSGRESGNLARAVAYLKSSGALEVHPSDSSLVRHVQVQE